MNVGRLSENSDLMHRIEDILVHRVDGEMHLPPRGGHFVRKLGEGNVAAGNIQGCRRQREQNGRIDERNHDAKADGSDFGPAKEATSCFFVFFRFLTMLVLDEKPDETDRNCGLLSPIERGNLATVESRAAPLGPAPGRPEAISRSD